MGGGDTDCGADARPDGGGTVGDDMADPIDISIDRQHSLTVVYDDGVTASFALGELRRACPCAACKGAREQGRDPYSPRPGTNGPWIIDADLVGAWGVSIRWDDGHDTGIYSWDTLRRWYDGESE
jgi:DUF971 family protein